MKSESNVVMKILTAILWCLASVGCVAEETKLPVASVEAAVPVKDVRHGEDKSSVISDEEIKITTHVDSETGKEYQELEASFIVDKFNRAPSEHRYVVGINNIAIEIGINTNSDYRNKRSPRGDIHYPAELVMTYEDKINWSVLKGKKASLYCRVSNPVMPDEKFCDQKRLRNSCSQQGDFNFLFKYHCVLSGKNEYFLKFN